MLNNEQLIVGTIMYLILESSDKSDIIGKRSRKNLYKSLKKTILTHGNSTDDKERYLKMVNIANNILQKAHIDFDDENLLVNPGVMFKHLVTRYPEIIGVYDLSKTHINDLSDAYKGSFGFPSIKYVNRIVERVRNEERKNTVN